MSCSFGQSGCDGGDTLNAWMYWMISGIVTGGLYGSKIVSYSADNIVNTKTLAKKTKDLLSILFQ